MTAKPTIAAIGAGRMGRGMGHVFAYAGYPVTIVDFKPRSADAFTTLKRDVLAEIRGDMTFLSSLDVMTEAQVEKALTLVEVAPLEGAGDVIAAADFLLEAVPETREAKVDVFGRLGEFARPDAVIASSTSTMLVTELQEMVSHPERFLNAHFLNPAFLIPLVELSVSPTTDEAVIRRLMDLFEAVGKVPVRCNASPGYIIPRLQSLIMAETARMVHEGVATPEEIDRAIMNGFGPRYTTMGVVEFIDWGGVDIMWYACNYLADALNSDRHRPPPEVGEMMADGRRGMREGQGYYDFRNMDVDAFRRQKLEAQVGLMRHLGRLPPPGV
jgi:3-hydroxybutyryl-CoA dehydrogenase